MIEFLHSYHFLYNVLIVTFSILVTLLVISLILQIARTRHLYNDEEHFHEGHDYGISRLGGIAIFVSFITTMLIFSTIDKVVHIGYLIISCIILFATGLQDDLTNVNFSNKLPIQFIVATILVLLGNTRITSMYGLLGVFNLSYVPSVIFSILLIMLIANSFSLIDRIDGLAATTGLIIHSTLAWMLVLVKQYDLAAICLATAGATVGFLCYNITPAKIFMGNAGALLIGLVSAVMVIKYLEVSKLKEAGGPCIITAPALTVAILIVPVFNTLKVFTLRILKGASPFESERNYMPHQMLKLGLNHLQATLCLAAINLGAIGFVLFFNILCNTFLITIILLISIVFDSMVTFCIWIKEH